MKTALISQAIMRWCFILLAALIPVFFIPVPWSTVEQSKLLLIAAAALAASLAWVSARISDRSLLLPRSSIAIAGLLVPIAYLLSALFTGINPASLVSGVGAQDTVAGMFLLYAVLLIGALAFQSASAASIAFLRAMMGGGLVLMIVQAFHVLFPGVTLGVLSGAASSIFGSWHELGIIAALFVFLAVALMRTLVTEGAWRWIALALALLSGFVLCIVNTRDAWFALAAVLIAYAVHRWYATRSHENAYRRLLVPALIAAIAIACGIFTSGIYGAMPARLQVFQIEVRPSWVGTFEIGRKAIDGPVVAAFGSGPNTFTRQWSLYKPVGVNATEFWNVDFNTGVGSIPSTFVTVGLLGMMAWAALLLALILSAWRYVRARSETPVSGVYTVLYLAAFYLAAFHIAYVPSIGLSALTFLLLGVLASAGGSSGAIPLAVPGGWRTVGTILVAFFAALAVLVASLGSIRAAVSDLLVNRSAVIYAQTNDVRLALSSVQNALAIYPNNDRAHRAAVELGLMQLAELSARGDTSEAVIVQLRESLERTIRHGLAAVSINNGGFQNWLALASFYKDLAGAGVEGAYENASAAYQEAYANNPSNPVTLVYLAQLEAAQENTETAVQLLNQAISLKINFAAAYFLRSQIYAAAENFEPALRDASAVVNIAPEDPLGWYNLGIILYADGSYEDAARSLEQAVALSTDYANALYVLALAYDRLGRYDQAIEALGRVQTLNPASEEVAELLNDMRSRSSGPAESEDDARE